MSDLISRSDLIHKIRGIVPGSQDVDFIVGLIENQPTAFDTEKVVAELEKAEKKGTDLIGKPHMDSNVLFGWGCAINEAIDIVKKGGVE